MSVTQKSFCDFMEKLSKQFDLEIDEVKECAGDLLKKQSPYTAKAKIFAEKNDIDIQKVKAKGEKVTVDDIRKFMGISKGSDAFTAKARILAKENDLTESDFPVKSRSGKVRKTGVKEITIGDVRENLGLTKKSSPKASPKAKEMAEKLGVDLAKVDGSGKDGRIKKEDIEKFVKESEDSDSESESEDEN